MSLQLHKIALHYDFPFYSLDKNERSYVIAVCNGQVYRDVSKHFAQAVLGILSWKQSMINKEGKSKNLLIKSAMKNNWLGLIGLAYFGNYTLEKTKKIYEHAIDIELRKSIIYYEKFLMCNKNISTSYILKKIHDEKKLDNKFFLLICLYNVYKIRKYSVRCLECILKKLIHICSILNLDYKVYTIELENLYTSKNHLESKKDENEIFYDFINKCEMDLNIINVINPWYTFKTNSDIIRCYPALSTLLEYNTYPFKFENPYGQITIDIFNKNFDILTHHDDSANVQGYKLYVYALYLWTFMFPNYSLISDVLKKSMNNNCGYAYLLAISLQNNIFIDVNREEFFRNALKCNSTLYGTFIAYMFYEDKITLDNLECVFNCIDKSNVKTVASYLLQQFVFSTHVHTNKFIIEILLIFLLKHCSNIEETYISDLVHIYTNKLYITIDSIQFDLDFIDNDIIKTVIQTNVSSYVNTLNISAQTHNDVMEHMRKYANLDKIENIHIFITATSLYKLCKEEKIDNDFTKIYHIFHQPIKS